MNKLKEKAEFGDFQTPPELARQVCEILSAAGVTPATIIEPTCGVGHFLLAALDRFPKVQKAHALDINPAYTQTVTDKLRTRRDAGKVEVICKSFFDIDWESLLQACREPVLFIGNPPWVTNAELGSLESTNLPEKTNSQGDSGIDAITGKGNFDISEWMLTHLLERLDGRRGVIAMLCKTTVARKVLANAWKRGLNIGCASIYPIDTKRHFAAAVEACLLICERTVKKPPQQADVYDSLLADRPVQTIGFHDGYLLADVLQYNRWKHLLGKSVFRWRSGIKHDCSRVMEFTKQGEQYRNGRGEIVTLEDRYLYPMLKSSQLANGSKIETNRWMLVTQQMTGDPTSQIEKHAPKTWNYLLSHADSLQRRRSSIYRNRPPFSIFGIGPYTFAPWKVAISGFYKNLRFRLLGPYLQKPLVLDDTCSFLHFYHQEEAEYVATLLSSEIAKQFYSTFIFPDAKRPITIDLLSKLDFRQLACENGTETSFNSLFAQHWEEQKKQRPLFSK